MFSEKPSPVFGSCTWQRREDIGVVSEHFILVLGLCYINASLQECVSWNPLALVYYVADAMRRREYIPH